MRIREAIEKLKELEKLYGDYLPLVNQETGRQIMDLIVEEGWKGRVVKTV